MNPGFMEYQVRARETSAPADQGVLDLFVGLESVDRNKLEEIGRLLRIGYATAGLSNEAGEVAGKFKKLIRDRGGVIDEEFRVMMAGELGDVLWYLADCCSVLNINLGAVAMMNLAKLKARKEAGTLQGDGDNR